MSGMSEGGVADYIVGGDNTPTTHGTTNNTRLGR